MSVEAQLQWIAAVTAVACALPGAFLVLRRQALLSDAISHVVLLGIVLGFLCAGELRSPWLVIGAALTGLVTVSLVELLQSSRLIRVDAAIGLVFPALFSLAVVLISRYASRVHIDTDAVLMGELAMAPFDRLELGGLDFGPRAFVVMSGVLVLNLGFIVVFFKELKLATFDPALATALGFAPGMLHYVLMSLVSLTCVAAFDAVGSVLVVALMIVPAATALLLTDRLSVLLGLTAVIAVVGAWLGYRVAAWKDANIAGSMAMTLGGLFGLAWFLAPERGLVAQAIRRAYQRAAFRETVLCVHLATHEGTAEQADESRPDRLAHHLRWRPSLTEQVARSALHHGYVAERDGLLVLTPRGRDLVRQTLGESE